MKINSTNSPKNILRKWQERAQDSERVFLSATPGLIRPQGDIHLHDHVIDYGWQEDDVHLRAGRPDRDQDGAAGRRLHRLRPLLGEGEVFFISVRWNGEYLTLLCSGNIFVSFLVQMPGNCRNISDEVFPGIHVGDKWVFTVLLLWSECCLF